MLILEATTKIPIIQNSYTHKKSAENNTNTNKNTNSADSSSSSSATADNTNNINNTATATQSQEQSACAVAVTCPEGTTTVTPPPTTTCNPSTVGGQTATRTDDTCRATIPFSAGDEATGIFISECNSIQGGNVVGDLRTQEFICTFPSTPPT